MALTTKLRALLALAKTQVGVREDGGPNAGPLVEAYQRATGNEAGASWCMSFQVWLSKAVWGKFPLVASGACEAVRQDAKKKGWLTKTPQVGSLGFVVDRDKDHAHHVFLVTGEKQPNGRNATIEGNTNDDGSSNGTGVFERTRTWGHPTYDYVTFPDKI